MNMDDLMKEIDGAWPQGMPPKELDVCVMTEDQVILDIKGLTLQMINDKETVVIEFVPVNFDDITIEQLDQMAEFIQKKKAEKGEATFVKNVAQPLADEFNDKTQQEKKEKVEAKG